MSLSKKSKIESIDSSDENTDDNLDKIKINTYHLDNKFNNSSFKLNKASTFNHNFNFNNSLLMGNKSNDNKSNDNKSNDNKSNDKILVDSLLNKIQYLITNVDSMNLKFNSLFSKINLIENQLKEINQSKKEDKHHTEKYQDLIENMINLNVKCLEKDDTIKNEISKNKKVESSKNIIDDKKINDDTQPIDINERMAADSSKKDNTSKTNDIENKIKPEILNMYS